MPVDDAELDRQKWLPRKARALLTLPAVSSPDGSDDGSQGGDADRVVGKMTASKIKIDELCDHFRSNSGQQELRARLAEYEQGLKEKRKEKLRLAGTNFVTQNKLILTPLEAQEDQQHMFDELRFRSRGACIRRNIILAERQRYYIDVKTETRELKHTRDKTFADCVNELIHSRLLYLQQAWLAKVIFALGTQKYIDAVEHSKRNKAMVVSLKASRIIMRLLRRAARNRMRFQAANILVEMLKSFAEMSRIKVFVMRLKKGVLFAQRQFRKRRKMTQYHLELLLRQWQKFEEKQRVIAQVATIKPHTIGAAAAKSPTGQQKAVGRQRSAGRRGSVMTPTATPTSRSKASTPSFKDTQYAAPADISRKTKINFLKPWLLGKRQEYTFNRCLYEKYEVWPQLVEFVSSQRKPSGEKVFRDRRKARQLCDRLKKSGGMVTYLKANGDILPKPPKYCRFVEESALLDMHQRAVSQTEAEKALAATLLGSSASLLDTDLSDLNSSPSMSPSSRGGRTPKGGARRQQGSFTGGSQKKNSLRRQNSSLSSVGSAESSEKLATKPKSPKKKKKSKKKDKKGKGGGGGGGGGGDDGGDDEGDDDAEDGEEEESDKI